MKCNCDGVSKGNSDESSSTFCVEDQEGELVWSECQRIGMTTNNWAEVQVHSLKIYHTRD